MIVRRLLRAFVAPRTTVLVLCLLALLLLLNVVLPQASVVGEERLAELVEGRPVLRFVLLDLRLSRMAGSPVFVGVLVLFFLNLTLVLGRRLKATWRQVQVRPRTEAALLAWTRTEKGLEAELPAGWDLAHVVRVLNGFGYRVQRAGGRACSGVKHRTAPLGFLLFHLSFLLLCAGGLLIHATRFDGYALLTEGQEFAGAYADIDRQPPWGGRPKLAFALVEVEPRFEQGEPVHLAATFRFGRAGAPVDRRARVNAPAAWGDSILLVTQAGLAPVLWLQDAEGFTLDRVGSPVRTRGGLPTEIPIEGGRLIARVHPLDPEAGFPSRAELPDTRLFVEVLEDGRLLHEGWLRPRESAAFGDRRLVLEELRYWAGFRVIAERGGGLLVLGYVAGVLGLLWRLLMYRRELALTWDERICRLAGHGEYFSHRFESELGAIRDALARTPDDGAASRRDGSGA